MRNTQIGRERSGKARLSTDRRSQRLARDSPRGPVEHDLRITDPVKGVGSGVFEYRIDFGLGYGVYFGKDGDMLVVLVGGGTKKKQANDIARAAALGGLQTAEEQKIGCH
jgi:putative component of toxin-antitoxin plasmid stabilization module